VLPQEGPGDKENIWNAILIMLSIFLATALLASILRYSSQIENYREKIQSYNKTNGKMLNQYLGLFQKLLIERETYTPSEKQFSTWFKIARIRLMDKLYKYHLKVGSFIY